jgi:hypothetical protein
VVLQIKKVNPKRKFSSQEIEEIKALFPNISSKELAEKYQCSIYIIHSLQKRLNLSKSEEHLAKMHAFTNENLIKYGEKNRFKKGHIPDNTGKQMSQKLYEKMKPTFFPKGHIPSNYKPIGTEVMTEDGYK